MKKKEISGYRKTVAIKLKIVFVVYGILNMAGSQILQPWNPTGAVSARMPTCGASHLEQCRMHVSPQR